MYQKKLESDIRCPLEYGLEIFGGKWDSRIICVLSSKETLRYSEIRKEMGNITDAVLATTLKALMNSSTVISAWDGERLVGLVRVLDDSELVAYMHYVLVHPDYHGQGIAGHMLELVKEKYKDYLYIELMPEECRNAAFYEKHGFQIMRNGAAMQRCNFANRI